MTVFTEAVKPADQMSPASATRALALVAGVAVLAGPRRTRPLAGVLYGVMLSRVHGAARDRVTDQIRRRIEQTDEAFAMVRDGQRMNAEHFDGETAKLIERVESLEACFGGDPAAWRRRSAEAAADAAPDDTGGGACA